MRRVKIVATLGPASRDRRIVEQLVREGVDVFRLNFSHGEHGEHRQTFETVRRVAAEAGLHVAVLADLCGPKIRAGEITDGAARIVKGDEITITTEPVIGDARRFSTSYEALPRDVRPGDSILLDDGLLELSVKAVDGKEILCSVVVGGRLKSRKGMNIPGTHLSTPAMTEKDRADLLFAKELGVDFFALSFVRTAADIEEAKRLAGDVPVIAKIEKPEAVAALQAVVDAADGVMVARGDLGVEAGAEKVPLIQKRIIAEAARAGKPVIVATQMLDSMIHNPRPTRAEVSDVANAVLDGTDAVMLSGETAAGDYPVEAVRTMDSVLKEVELSDIFEHRPRPARFGEYSFSNAIARAAVTAAEDLALKAMAVYTETGHSATLVSNCRPVAPVIALSRHREVLRRLALTWGVEPVESPWLGGVSNVVMNAQESLKSRGLVEAGDDIAVTFGMQDMSGPGRTDVLKLWRVTE